MLSNKDTEDKTIERRADEITCESNKFLNSDKSKRKKYIFRIKKKKQKKQKQKSTMEKRFGK